MLFHLRIVNARIGDGIGEATDRAIGSFGED